MFLPALLLALAWTIGACYAVSWARREDGIEHDVLEVRLFEEDFADGR